MAAWTARSHQLLEGIAHILGTGHLEMGNKVSFVKLRLKNSYEGDRGHNNNTRARGF